MISRKIFTKTNKSKHFFKLNGKCFFYRYDCWILNSVVRYKKWRNHSSTENKFKFIFKRSWNKKLLLNQRVYLIIWLFQFQFQLFIVVIFYWNSRKWLIRKFKLSWVIAFLPIRFLGVTCFQRQDKSVEFLNFKDFEFLIYSFWSSNQNL